MPSRDGKGPYGGGGPRSGRKLGKCKPTKSPKRAGVKKRRKK